VELGVDRIVHYHDWLPAAEFGRLLEESKIVAIPSRWPEPFGLVGLEAMRLGRAVVAYDVGGIRDWVIDGETGTLVPEQDVGAFADACADLLQNSDKAAEFGRRGRARAESDFGFDRYITQIERIFSGAESSTADAQAR
jgi:glycosyltransferase involved in cell wall biosynthesis